MMLPLIVTCFLIGGLFYVLWSRTTTKLNVPILGIDAEDLSSLKGRYVASADALLREGHQKFKEGMFQVATPDGPRLFLPRKFADDFRKYKREQASGMKALSDRHLGDYTTIGHENPIMLQSIKIDLNRNLGNFVDAVDKEVAHCINELFPACEDWTAINLQETLMRVVAQASQRIFVGLPMCRDEAWLDCTIKFAGDVMIGGEKLKRWPPWLRPIAQYWIPEMTQIGGDHKHAYELIKKESKRRDEQQSAEPYYDMIEWMRQRAKKLGDSSFDDKELANLQVLTATAAIHTTRLALIHTLYDLAARPEYIQPLREEILSVRGDGTAKLEKQDLTSMKKLDSFMKESIRHNPPSVATVQRKALIPITLSNGFRIPTGTVAQCTTQILDDFPEEYGNAHDFDGFRFYNLRQNPEHANRHQFSSVSYDSMQFGYGNDACPGRFFASNQIKIVLSRIIRHFDIKFPDEIVGRPQNPMFEVNVLADPTAEVLFKRRSLD